MQQSGLVAQRGPEYSDLFTERYTKSEVTGQEYDTEVKNKAEPRAITA